MTTPTGPSNMDTRGIPYSDEEFRWAHQRPARHWVPFPHIGDTVCYRHDAWGEVTEGDVVWVQPEDDVDDPHVYTPTLERGRPVLFEGRAVMARKPDPWRLLRIRTRYGLVETREARLRGAPGWLPRDWRARTRPLEGPTIEGGTTHLVAAEQVPALGRPRPQLLVPAGPRVDLGGPGGGAPAPAEPWLEG